MSSFSNAFLVLRIRSCILLSSKKKVKNSLLFGSRLNLLASNWSLFNALTSVISNSVSLCCLLNVRQSLKAILPPRYYFCCKVNPSLNVVCPQEVYVRLAIWFVLDGQFSLVWKVINSSWFRYTWVVIFSLSITSICDLFKKSDKYKT